MTVVSSYAMAQLVTGYVNRCDNLESCSVAECHAETLVTPECVVVPSGVMHSEIAGLASAIYSISTENILVHVPSHLGSVRCVDCSGFSVGRRCRVGTAVIKT